MARQLVSFPSHPSFHPASKQTCYAPADDLDEPVCISQLELSRLQCIYRHAVCTNSARMQLGGQALLDGTFTNSEPFLQVQQCRAASPIFVIGKAVPTVVLSKSCKEKPGTKRKKQRMRGWGNCTRPSSTCRSSSIVINFLSLSLKGACGHNVPSI